METKNAFVSPEVTPVQGRFAKRVVETLEEWGLEPQIQLKVLGLPADQECLLARYKASAGALPADFDSLFVAVKVLTLNRLVRELLEDGSSVYDWMNRRLPSIGNQPPAVLIAASPRRGLDRVARVVDSLLAAG
jgi:hypothetical protein